MNGLSLELARTHAPVLALTILLIGAALAALTPQGRVSWLVALGAACGALVVLLDLALDTLVDVMPAPMTIEGVALALDGIGLFAAPLVTALLVMALLGGASSLSAMPNRASPYAMALTVCVGAGWVGALLASDLIGLIVAAQIAWLATVGLVGVVGDRGALNGALRMWTVGGVGAALMLLGLAFVTRGVGSEDVSAAASALVLAPTLAAVGAVMLLLPLAVAAGLAPLHGWTGAAYGRAHSFVMIALGAVGAIGAAAVLLRVSAHIASAPAIAEGVAAALVALGVTSVVIGAVQAVGAVNMGRLIAYAGATQAGCVVLAAALESPAGFAAALLQLFAWSAGALALLVGAAAAGSSNLSSLDGLVRRAPLASVAITAGALSYMGAPLTIGFLGRWRLIEASVGAGWWWATGAAIAASLAAVFYGGRLIERIYFRRATETAEQDRDPWRFARVPVTLAALVAIGLGVAPDMLMRAATRAAALVMGHGL